MLRRRLWTNASFTTFSPSCERATSMFTEGGRIVAVGGEEVAEAHRGQADEVIDLGGRWVIPGMTDSHIHFVDLGFTLRQIALENCGSAAEVVEKVRRADHAPKGWIVGAGFQVNLWQDGQAPHRSLLDAHFPNRAVTLHSRCFHQMWVNSAALRAAGITAATPDPEGGRIVRDESGEPTGLLQEEANGLIYRVRPGPTPAEWRRAARESTEHLWSHGIVAVQAPESEETLDVLRALHGENQLGMRVHFLPPFSIGEKLHAAGARLGDGDRWLRLGPLKMFLDGALGSATALMNEPYDTDPANRGIEVTSEKTFREACEWAHSRGWRLAVHAIGDRAVDVAVNNLAASQRTHGLARNDLSISRPLDRTTARPHNRTIWDRIEHFQVFSPGTPERAACAQIAAMMQPVHLFDDWGPADRHWGARTERAYACRTLLDAHVPVCLGSDAPVASATPFWCIHAAVKRTDLEGQPEGGWHPSEALSAREAVRSFCVEPAMITAERRGILVAGLPADFVVLDSDPWSTEVDWLSMKADLTVVEGAIVFDRHGEHREREWPVPEKEKEAAER